MFHPGRFPSDLKMQTIAPQSSVSDDSDNETGVAAVVLPGSSQYEYSHGDDNPYRLQGVPSGTHTRNASTYTDGGYPGAGGSAYDGTYLQSGTTTEPVQTQTFSLPLDSQQPVNQQQLPTSSQQPFSGSEAAAMPEYPVHHDSSFNDLIAPAAAGVAGVGAGALGADAHKRHEQDATIPQAQPETAVPSTSSAEASSNGVTALDGNKVLVATPSGMPTTVASLTTTYSIVPDTSLSSSTTATTAAATATETDSSAHDHSLGGNEAEGAHETGQIFPRVVRHDTSLSVSKLHVPGEFPKQI